MKIKLSLLMLIDKMISNNMKIESMFSDYDGILGNIGYNYDFNNPKYLISQLSDMPIRVLMTCIKNLINNKKNGLIILDYINNYEFLFLNKTNKWIIERKKNIMTATNLSNDKSRHWCDLNSLYEKYKIKKNNYDKINLNNLINPINPINPININELYEKITENEIIILKNVIDGNQIYVETGMKNEINKINKINLSGHALLALDLTQIYETNWKLMFLACIIYLVPLHHTVNEIVESFIEMNKLIIIDDYYYQLFLFNEKNTHNIIKKLIDFV
jgi:hypothetical protein